MFSWQVILVIVLRKEVLVCRVGVGHAKFPRERWQ